MELPPTLLAATITGYQLDSDDGLSRETSEIQWDTSCTASVSLRFTIAVDCLLWKDLLVDNDAEMLRRYQARV